MACPLHTCLDSRRYRRMAAWPDSGLSGSLRHRTCALSSSPSMAYRTTGGFCDPMLDLTDFTHRTCGLDGSRLMTSTERAASTTAALPATDPDFVTSCVTRTLTPGS